jgi:putative membrane protein
MLGGGLKVGSGVLYAYVIIPLVENGDFTFLKYDQVIHFYGFALVAFVTYYLLRRSTTLTDKWLVPLCIFAAMGFGALNETLEFIGVLMIPETGVGGYYNTSLDLVANALGAATAAVIAPYIFKKHPPVDRQAQESA